VTVVWIVSVTAAASPATGAAAPAPVAGTIDLAQADTRFDNTQGGSVVAFAGDMNGDGIGDQAIATPLLAPSTRRDRAGVVRVVFGRPGPAVDLLDPQRAGMTVWGPTTGARTGTSLAAVGDLNGDGLGDLLVGAPRVSFRGRGKSAGAAYIVFGSRDGGTVDLAVPGGRAAVVMGVAHGYHAGMSVAALGDLDGDGRREIVIGAPGATVAGRPGAGAAYVVLSSRLGPGADLARAADFGYEIDGASAGGGAGGAVAGSGDMNGDGLPEVLVGARGAGAAYAVWGRRDPTPVDLAALGAQGFAMLETAGEHVGAAIADAGDVNGDGASDVVVGAPAAGAHGRARSGTAYVVYGRGATVPVALPTDAAGGFRIDGAATGDRLGTAVAGAGDADGDGRVDVLVGAPGASPLRRADAGAAYLVLGGPLDLALPGAGAVRLAGSAETVGTGRSLAGGTDVDGDGRPDVLLGTELGTAALVLTPSVRTPLPASRPLENPCTGPVTNIEAIVGDSATMRERDPGLLRRQALQLLLAKPRPQPTVLGAVEFGTGAAEIFPPLVLGGADFTAQLDVMPLLIAEHLRADAGRRSLAAGFAAAAAENPGRQAQILIVDGANNVGPEPLAPAVGVPTYVVGLGVRAGSPAARQLDRLATESRGRFFGDVSADQLQPVLNDIDTALACETPLPVTSPAAPSGSKSITPPPVTLAPGEAAAFSAPLPAPNARRTPVRSLSIVVSWHRRATPFTVRAIELRRGAQKPVRIPARIVSSAIARHRTISLHGVLITARRSHTFIAIRLRGALIGAPGAGARAATSVLPRVTARIGRPRPHHPGGPHHRRAVRVQISASRRSRPARRRSAPRPDVSRRAAATAGSASRR
jgi:hypothetical protein